MKYKSLIVAIISLIALGASAQVNPVPTIDAPVYPQAVVPGSNALTLTVRGANFVPGAVVNWNGSARSTTFVSAWQLQAQILASDVAVAGSALITVTNPPPGGGASSSSFAVVEIHQPIASIMLTQPHKYLSTESNPRLFTSDLNGDGKEDLIELSYGITVLLGNGDGTFTQSASLKLFYQPVGLSFGDFNGDGKMDFALAIYERGLAFVALGDGTGKFQVLRGFGSFTMPAETVTGDFNRDGKLDLLVTASDGVYILYGNGDGTFQTQQIASSLSFPSGLTGADFNEDGILDFACVDGRNGLFAIMLGNGLGAFQPPIETQQGDYAQTLLSDFNGDGKLDFVIEGSGTGAPIGILLGNGDGTFQPPQFYSTGFAGQLPFLMVGDFSSDGNADVFSYGEMGFLAGFLAGNGDGTFQGVARFTMPGPVFKLLPVVGDFNSDGLLDFAVGTHDGSEVYLQAPQ